MTDRALLEDLIALAAWAPSPHNTQPWEPFIDGAAIAVSVVPSRTLPAGDPTFRDLVLSLGAWVECVAVGAAAAGRGIEVDVLPGLAELDELPVSGPADRGAPVLRVGLTGSGASPFTPEQVRSRAVFRGPLDGDAGVFAALDDARLPEWLSLRPIDAPLMGALSRLGIAYTASRRPIAEELLHWLRLSPRHPRYASDGLDDRVLQLPRTLARVASPFTRSRTLRDAALAVAAPVGRVAEVMLLGTRPLPERPGGGRNRATHHALVADVRAAGAGDLLSHTEALGNRIGLPESQVLDAGRALQRLWLHAHRSGVAVSPHSEIIDSPAAYGALRRRLGLGRADVVLAVFSAGRPRGEVPRAPRRGGARST